MNKYLAEGIGAFTLTLVVALSVAHAFPVPTAVLAALVLGTFVYTIGHISGSHINPAVTLGVLSIGKIKLQEAVVYIIAQVIGACVAGVLVYNILGNTSPLSTSFNAMTLFAELLGAAVFTFGIASVVYGKVKDAAGIVIGTSLLLGIAVAVLIGSAGGLNPAVMTGLRLFDISYVVGPILGSIIGFNLYKYILNE